MSEGSWLRDKAAVVGFGHSTYGKRGQFAAGGTTPLVIEAIVNACEDAGVAPADVDGYTSYSHDAVDPGIWPRRSARSGCGSPGWVGAAGVGPWGARSCMRPWRWPPGRLIWWRW